MTRLDDDAILRSALGPARNLTPTEAEISGALERAQTRSPSNWRRPLTIALAAMVLLTGASYTVPVTRAAIDDLTGSFAGWVGGGDEQAPGRALRPEDDAPSWVREKGGRLIVETGGVGLYVTRTTTPERGTQLDFALGEGVGIGDSIEGWRERFDQHTVVVLGTTPVGRGRLLDGRGRFPLLGVTARSVDSVELRYASGPPLVANGLKGGFVLLADARRSLDEIVGYDSNGRELERTDVSHIDMQRVCARERDCQSNLSVEP